MMDGPPDNAEWIEGGGSLADTNLLVAGDLASPLEVEIVAPAVLSGLAPVG